MHLMNFIAPYRYSCSTKRFSSENIIQMTNKNWWNIKLMRFINSNKSELIQHSWNMTNQFWSIRFKK